MVQLALAQYPVFQHTSFAAWQEHTENWVKRTADAEIVVFPEYGSMELVSLFPAAIQRDLHAQLHEMQQLLPGFAATFRQLARKTNKVIVAPSFPVLIGEKFINRALVFGPGGEGYQDKWHMTRFENEDWGVHAGEKKLTVFEANGVRFGIQICYDVEFPAGSRLLAQAGADILLAPSCTETIRGAARVHTGARARAMENQLYTAVSQTILNAAWSPAVDINYGYAAVYCSPDKNLPELGIVSEGRAQEPAWEITGLDLGLNKLIREDGQVLNFRDFGFHEIMSDGVTIVNVHLTP